MSAQAPFKASPLYFSPVSPSHQPAPGKESYGRYMLVCRHAFV